MSLASLSLFRTSLFWVCYAEQPIRPSAIETANAEAAVATSPTQDTPAPAADPGKAGEAEQAKGKAPTPAAKTKELPAMRKWGML